MGCDIHLHTEIKINGTWHHYTEPRVPRCYELFGLMAGVRGDNDPIVAPKGFPDDSSEVSRLMFERDGPDAHTPSWIDAVEIKKLYKEIEKLPVKIYKYGINWEIFGYCTGNGWDAWVDYPNERAKWIEDIRWVFWFDN
jgi:hypothetical protein